MPKLAHSSDRAAVAANIELYDTANLACEFLDQIELLLGFLSKCDDARQREVLHVLAQNTVDNYGPLMADARDKAADRLPS